MEYTWCLKNGDMIATESASVPLSNIEYAYGFGVYETVRVVHGTPLFLTQHLERLLRSAEIIGLRHTLHLALLAEWTTSLLRKNEADTCNVKMLLIGAREPKDAMLWMIPLAPLFPDKRLFTRGVSTISIVHERFLPQAKTLNMLPSYLHYGTAKAAGCYDALLVNQAGCVTEGTRTNVLALRGRTIVSPPSAEILEGVTRANVLNTARANGFEIVEEPLPLETVFDCDGLLFTSTSSKIMPISKVNDRDMTIPDTLRELIGHYDAFLASLLPR